MQTDTVSMTHSGFLRDQRGTQGSYCLPFLLLLPLVKSCLPICHISLVDMPNACAGLYVGWSW